MHHFVHADAVPAGPFICNSYHCPEGLSPADPAREEDTGSPAVPSDLPQSTENQSGDLPPETSVTMDQDILGCEDDLVLTNGSETEAVIPTGQIINHVDCNSAEQSDSDVPAESTHIQAQASRSLSPLLMRIEQANGYSSSSEVEPDSTLNSTTTAHDGDNNTMVNGTDTEALVITNQVNHVDSEEQNDSEDVPETSVGVPERSLSPLLMRIEQTHEYSSSSVEAVAEPCLDSTSIPLDCDIVIKDEPQEEPIYSVEDATGLSQASSSGTASPVMITSIKIEPDLEGEVQPNPSFSQTLCTPADMGDVNGDYFMYTIKQEPIDDFGENAADSSQIRIVDGYNTTTGQSIQLVSA